VSRFLTQSQARMIMDAHEIEALLDNEEETDLLEQHNPDLLDAYLNLQGIADGSD
jgi:hypothetical protein